MATRLFTSESVAAGHPEGGVQHPAVAQEAAGVGPVALEEDGKIVAWPQLALEVEFVPEDADQVVGQRLGHAAALRTCLARQPS